MKGDRMEQSSMEESFSADRINDIIRKLSDSGYGQVPPEDPTKTVGERSGSLSGYG